MSKHGPDTPKQEPLGTFKGRTPEGVEVRSSRRISRHRRIESIDTKAKAEAITKDDFSSSNSSTEPLAAESPIESPVASPIETPVASPVPSPVPSPLEFDELSFDSSNSSGYSTDDSENSSEFVSKILEDLPPEAAIIDEEEQEEPKTVPVAEKEQASEAAVLAEIQAQQKSETNNTTNEKSDLEILQESQPNIAQPQNNAPQQKETLSLGQRLLTQVERPSLITGLTIAFGLIAMGFGLPLSLVGFALTSASIELFTWARSSIANRLLEQSKTKGHINEDGELNVANDEVTQTLNVNPELADVFYKGHAAQDSWKNYVSDALNAPKTFLLTTHEGKMYQLGRATAAEARKRLDETLESSRTRASM